MARGHTTRPLYDNEPLQSSTRHIVACNSASAVSFQWRQWTVTGSGVIGIYATLEARTRKLRDPAGDILPPAAAPWDLVADREGNPLGFPTQPSGAVGGDQVHYFLNNAAFYLLEIVVVAPFDRFSLFIRQRET